MHLNDFKEALEQPEIRLTTEVIEGKTVSIVCYMIATTELWDIPGAIDCRGLVFDEEGNCICATMPKFFNINENKYTQLNDLDFENSTVFGKLDGSMISVVRINGKLFCKSKKTFSSPVAKAAQQFLESHQNYKDLCNWLIDNDITPTFEFMHPDHQIVVHVQSPSMSLIYMRDMKNGKEFVIDSDLEQDLLYNEIQHVAGFNLNSHKLISNYFEYSKEAVGIEGWVFKLSNGQRVKLKTDWYLARHRLTSYHERNIAEMIVEETIDDIMTLINDREGGKEVVERISHEVHNNFAEMKKNTQWLVDHWLLEGFDLAHIGKNFSNVPEFSLAISLFKNREPDWKKFWNNNYRKTYSTKPAFWGSSDE